MTEDMLDRHFARYGRIKGLGLDRKRGYCMVSFEHIAGSTAAHNDLKERSLFGKRVRVCSSIMIMLGGWKEVHRRDIETNIFDLKALNFSS